VIANGSRDFKKSGIDKENIVLSVGRIHEGKGFQYLIEAFKNINKEGWKLCVVGDGPYRSELEKIANSDNSIIFIGWLDNNKDEFINLINKTKIFVLLSKFESQGIVFVEAMSAGCAILSSNISACAETVSEDVGFLVNRENINEISERLKDLMINQAEAGLLMENARKRYEESYDWNKIIKEYKKVL
jgi:glycosyltransferase involved in cell wall biosynthesis